MNREFKRMQELAGIILEDLQLVNLYEVYITDEEMGDLVVAFKDKETFDGPLGDYWRENFQIESQTYSKVNLSSNEIEELNKKGYITYK